MAGQGGALLAIDQEADLGDVGQVGAEVAQMESTVRDSVSRPEGWLAAKVPVRLTTAS